MRHLLLYFFLPFALLAESPESALKASFSAVVMGEQAGVTVSLVDENESVLILRERAGAAKPRPRPTLERTRLGYGETVVAGQGSPLIKESSLYLEALAKLLLEAWFSEPRQAPGAGRVGTTRCLLSIDLATGEVVPSGSSAGFNGVDPRLAGTLSKVRLPKPPLLLTKELGPRSCLLVSVYSLVFRRGAATASPPPSPRAAIPQDLEGTPPAPEVKEPKRKPSGVGVEWDVIPGGVPQQ